MYLFAHAEKANNSISSSIALVVLAVSMVVIAMVWSGLIVLEKRYIIQEDEEEQEEGTKE